MPDEEPESPYDPLFEQIQQWMAANQVSQAEFIRRTGIAKARVEKWHQKKLKVQLRDLPEIEKNLGVPLGTFLTQAGFVKDDLSFVDRIRQQPINEIDKYHLILLYESMLKFATEQQDH